MSTASSAPRGGTNLCTVGAELVPGCGHVKLVVRCPGCGMWLPEEDLQMQAAHMESEHPEIVEERRAESARWDGWENE